MASTHKSLRSSTADKRPTTAIADGQIALNTNAASPGLFFKDSTGASIIKIGPVHVGTTAPNVSPATGGSAGNSTGEAWLDTSLTPNGWKVWTGSAWVNATPAGSDTVQGLLELATNAETQAGSDTARAVTPAGLQSKMSDSVSTTSATTIASSTAVKTAYDLANAALPKSGGIVTGNLEIGNTGSFTFEGATVDAFETALTVVDPTADRTITLPDVTGTVVTTGDTGSVTNTMLAGSIADTKLNQITTASKVSGTALTGTIPSAVLGNSTAYVGTTAVALNRASANQPLTGISSIALPGATSGTITVTPTAAAGTTAITVPATSGTLITTGDTGTVTSTMILDGTILNADVNTAAAIAGTKISPDFGAQNITTTGISTAARFVPTASTVPTNGVYLPTTNTVGIATNSTQRVNCDAAGYIANFVSTNGEGRVPGYSYYRRNTTLAGTTAITAQSVLGVGVTLAGSIVYEFEGLFYLRKTAGTTAHYVNFGFGGTATINNFAARVEARFDPGANTPPFLGVATVDTFLTSATPTSYTTGNTVQFATADVVAHLFGTVSINAGGTFIPQYILSANPGGAYTTQIGSYFKIAPLDPAGVISIGTWA